MLIACLTIFSSILSPLQSVSYIKMHVYCVFDFFLFNVVSTSGRELRKSAYLLCVFLFNLVCTSAGELRKSVCLLRVWLFSLQSCLHFSRWVMWKFMFIVCLTIFSSILSPLQVVSYVKVHVHCVFDYISFQSCLHLSRLVTWKCMFIVCLTTVVINLVSTSDSELRESLTVYCVFDYFLFNLVCTLAGELCEQCMFIVCLTIFSVNACLHFSGWVTWKCMFIVCLTIFNFNLISTLQAVSYVKVHVYCVSLFSLQTCLHSWWHVNYYLTLELSNWIALPHVDGAYPFHLACSVAV